MFARAKALCLFACTEALCPSHQFFHHFGMEPHFLGINQYFYRHNMVLQQDLNPGPQFRFKNSTTRSPCSHSHERTHNHTQTKMSRIVRKPDFCLCENKGADQLRSNCEADHAFVFATRIVQSLFFLNPKFQASRSVCVRADRKPRRPVFSRRGSNLGFKLVCLSTVRYVICYYYFYVTKITTNWKLIKTQFFFRLCMSPIKMCVCLFASNIF